MTHAAAVWLVDCRRISDTELAPFGAWLGPSEQQRLARFVRDERRRQFIAGRALLRQSLAPLLGIAAADVPLVERPGQAPMLDLPGSEQVGFSLSHSGGWVGCAVSATTRLGFDLELVDPSRNIGELASQAFDLDTQAWLAARPEASRLRDFYRLWSAAEARFKLHAPVATEIAFPHPALSMVLCAAQVFERPPELKAAMLAPGE